eukprot:CAMPEP_0179258760 /NCGR_PEP_ID=MMETSP0797-20121207/25480_1 /TAXON_ID=47934 /ORGANISM="Dinophysis acuminata, Strain DAEP01" /LENGTH=207 /DNA_ID=CAMNT_0020966799 /DNA_START=72 /DNA_END=695 /DNA_ORIENTATION=+
MASTPRYASRSGGPSAPLGAQGPQRVEEVGGLLRLGPRDELHGQPLLGHLLRERLRQGHAQLPHDLLAEDRVDVVAEGVLAPADAGQALEAVEDTVNPLPHVHAHLRPDHLAGVYVCDGDPDDDEGTLPVHLLGAGLDAHLPHLRGQGLGHRLRELARDGGLRALFQGDVRRGLRGDAPEHAAAERIRHLVLQLLCDLLFDHLLRLL